MKGKELVARTLQGMDTPRVPSGSLAVHYCGVLAGYTLREYTTDARALADSVIRYYERFEPDAVWVSTDTWVSAEAMGVKVGATDDHQPLGAQGPPKVRSASDIDRIPPPDTVAQGRYPLMLEALSRVVAAVGQEACIVACFDQYPFSLAASLMGINEIMVKVLDDPQFVEALMARCSEYTIAYGRALAAVGADLLSGGDSPAGLLGPELYVRLALPFERAVTAALRTTGKPVSLHICGNATPLLHAMAGSGADVLELDHFVDLGKACRIAGPGITIWGNLDPVEILARGTPGQVEEAARNAVAAAQSAAHRRFVLSSGCTLAVETPGANLDVLNRVARSCRLSI